MFSTPRHLLFCAVALALVGAACSSASSLEAKRVQRDDVKVAPNVVHPLTGIAAPGSQAWQQRQALAIKVGNAPAERPQAGLDKADLIYEEIVEGGVTRFMAIFSTNDAARVGPVRSARKVDPPLFTPISGLFGYSGAAPSTLAVVRSASALVDVGVNRASGAYHRDRSRAAPYNLYTSTTELWAGRSGVPPRQQFTFLGPTDNPALGADQPATKVELSFAGNGSTIRYLYDAKTGRYARYHGESAHVTEGSASALSFRNVIVQTVGIKPGYSIDKAGFRTSDIDVTGSGEVIIFRGGRALRGRWERKGNEPTRFLDASGQEIRLAVGNTIVELLPQGREVGVS